MKLQPLINGCFRSGRGTVTSLRTEICSCCCVQVRSMIIAKKISSFLSHSNLEGKVLVLFYTEIFPIIIFTSYVLKDASMLP